MSAPRILIEACVGSVADAIAAAEAGADRIELSRALDQDGLTPSAEDIATTVGQVDVPVIAMLRPHDRGFAYTADEFKEMEGLVDSMLADGAAGIAVGVLAPDHTVHLERMAALVRRAAGRAVVFHRAFDVVRDPTDAIDQLVDLGVTRVLTSGQRDTALSGAATIRTLIERAGGRLEVLPGGGVGPHTAAELVARTGCSQLHGSFRGAAGRFDRSLLKGTRSVLDFR